MTSQAARRAVHFGMAAALIASIAGAAMQAQDPGSPFGGRRGRAATPEPAAENAGYDGRFAFVRLRYSSGGALANFMYRREPPWSHDFPRADRNLLKIVNEISYVATNLEAANLFSLDEAELFHFPVAYMAEPGFWTITDEQAANLRAYLLKGGFAIFDDFRGSDLENLQAQLRRALPDCRFVELDATHPLFHSFFEINSLEFHQFYDRGRPVFYGVFEDNDPEKRLLVIANYNNDLGEYWEFSDTGFVPIDLSNESYKFAVNYIVYAMTH